MIRQVLIQRHPCNNSIRIPTPPCGTSNHSATSYSQPRLVTIQHKKTKHTNNISPSSRTNGLGKQAASTNSSGTMRAMGVTIRQKVGSRRGGGEVSFISRGGEGWRRGVVASMLLDSSILLSNCVLCQLIGFLFFSLFMLIDSGVGCEAGYL